MRHLGDITKIHGSSAEPINVIIGGSPCQDLSVAGRRAGLDGERSGLFMDQIRIIKEMRFADEFIRGRKGKDIRPRFMVWENVPGAFSSNKGEDFRTVLEEIIKLSENKAPNLPLSEWGGRWSKSGCIVGVDRQFSIAWRVFDAQFWGVPQRRRRIALVADFGGMSAPEILFERKGMPGDPEQSGETGQGTATDAENGTAENDRLLAAGFSTEHSAKARSIGYEVDRSPTLRAGVVPATVYCIQGNCIDRADTAGCNGRGWTEDKSYTLNTVDRPAVVPLLNDQGGSSISGEDDASIAPTLRAEMHGNIPVVVYNDETVTSPTNAQNPQPGDPCHTLGTDSRNYVVPVDPIMIEMTSTKNTIVTNGICPTLTARMGTGGNQVNAVFCTDVGFFNSKEDQATTLLARMYKDPPVINDPRPRRLTPLECERLQGFPDTWTDIGEWIDVKGKKHKSSDSMRYKALGNSIALPPWVYVLQRLSLACGPDHTMASLFDGIGGFPLIWETLHGKGSCLWASEIEAFPIAVTERRFADD